MADVDVRDLLSLWNLSQYIDTFLEQGIDLAAMSLLTEDMIKELVPLIGHRAKLKGHLEEWRDAFKKTCASTDDTKAVSNELLDISNYITGDIPSSRSLNSENMSDSDNISINFSSPSSSISQNDSFVKSEKLSDFLKNNPEGRALLHDYERNGTLDNSSRGKLCHLIIRRELRHDCNDTITRRRLSDLANEITNVFPKERSSVYFIPYTQNGSYKKEACGKLYNCYNTFRKTYRRKSLKFDRDCDAELTRLENIADLWKESGEEETVSEAVSEKLKWLNNSTQPQETVLAYWLETEHVRLKAQFQSEKSIDEYMTKYPCLKKPDGYQLLLEDFKYMYCHHDNSLFENFPLSKGAIIELAEKKARVLKDQTLKSIVEKYKNELIEAKKPVNMEAEQTEIPHKKA